jgi:aminoglycoside phosphotransferase (APT) family kinase protein
VAAILAEVDESLAGIPRPSETPNHWRPMHGDFSPWNLRQLRGGSLVLLDWEDAGWGPPGADEVFYEATRAALRHQAAARCDKHEAVQFWRERVLAHPENVRDDRLAQALGEILGRMASQ